LKAPQLYILLLQLVVVACICFNPSAIR